MKKLLLVSILFLTLAAAFAQTKPKQKPKEKPPTQKEMNDMMKETQQMMHEMSPENKKMMDSMGVKMPDMKSIQKSGVTDAQLKKAFEDESRIVPLKDNARIASISKTPLTTATIPVFLQSVHEQLSGKLGTALTTPGESGYQWIKNKYQTPSAIGNAAVGCWIMGKPAIALYIMSKACKDDPADVDNLNNFSAFLTMAGGEQFAIPLLDNLNKRFPQNSTILNNIGQAWFGLGEIDKAEKYLDSAIRIYASHPQANMTKSMIEESHDHKQAAIEAVKQAIKHSYSMEKENRLNKLGYKLKSEDLTWNEPMPQDPLGLEKFNSPDFPMNLDDCIIMEPQWDDFKIKVANEINELKIKEKRLEAEMETASEKRMRELLQAGQNGIMVDPMPRMVHKASIKLKYLIDGKDGKLLFTYQKKVEALTEASLTIDGFEHKLEEALEVLEKKYEDQFGEGKTNPFDAACADDTKAKNQYLGNANSLLRDVITDWQNFMRRKLNDDVYYSQYTTWPDVFEVVKVQAQILWLGLLPTPPKFLNKSPWCHNKKEQKEDTTTKLAMFDDLHCAYKSKTTLMTSTITSECGKLEAKLDLDFLKLGLKMKQGDRWDESTWDQFQSCTIEIGIKKGVSLGEKGPLKAEAKVGVSGFVEVGKSGVIDAGGSITGGIKVGTNVIGKDGIKIEPIKGISTLGPSIGDQSVTIVGAEAKISIMSGFTVEGKGILNGVKTK